MASLIHDPGGRRRIQFLDGRRRRTIRLGQVSDGFAAVCKLHVEALLTFKSTGEMARSTAAWLADLDDELHSRLATVDLVTPRESATLQSWLDRYIACKGNLKPETIRKHRQVTQYLVDFFGAKKPLRDITRAKASEWRDQLAGRKTKRGTIMKPATVKSRTGDVKTIFREAVNRRLVDENPFGHLKGGTTAREAVRHIAAGDNARIIDHCPTAEWKLLFGLARYAGLRCLSEPHQLTVADIDWEQCRLTVRSPKTERFQGKSYRIVPVFPELLPLLEARYDELREGESKLITLRGGCVHKRAREIIQKAGVEPWDHLWQTLRSSCEEQWSSMGFPQASVSDWMGHSLTVSGKHYLRNTPDEVFERARQTPMGAAHKAAHFGSAGGRTGPRGGSRAPVFDAENAGRRTQAQEAIGGGGNRTPVP